MNEKEVQSRSKINEDSKVYRKKKIQPKKKLQQESCLNTTVKSEKTPNKEEIELTPNLDEKIEKSEQIVHKNEIKVNLGNYVSVDRVEESVEMNDSKTKTKAMHSVLEETITEEVYTEPKYFSHKQSQNYLIIVPCVEAYEAYETKIVENLEVSFIEERQDLSNNKNNEISEKNVEKSSNQVDNYLSSLTFRPNSNPENLPMIESVDLNNDKIYFDQSLSEEVNSNIYWNQSSLESHDINKYKFQFDKNDESEDLRSISSIEGSLRGIASDFNYLNSTVYMNSSTPLHIFQSDGIFNFAYSNLHKIF